jgi:ATP-dependent helicase/nuclease subunit A
VNVAQLRLGEEPPVEEPSAGPTPEQRRAIDARDRDVLLEAGAGTGKTLVLVERYCAAAEELSGIDGILAFTFTERAAGELRHRVRVELAARAARAAESGDGERAALLAGLSRDSERAWISTIHGFCRRLLASHPVAVGLDPRFRVLDEPEADRVAARAFDDALEALLADGDREIARLVAAVRVVSLRELVRTAHDELRSLGRAGSELPHPQPSDPAAAARELVAAAKAALDETSESRAGQANLDRIAAAAQLDPGSVPDEGELAALELNSGAKAFAGPACRRYRDAWRAARRAVVERDTAQLYGHLSDLVRGFGERYAALKEERSGLDFEDLQLEAVRLLRDRPGLAESYRQRFRHVMVDEFQDTNELQLQLVRLLEGPDTRVFAVGDEFQSIYGFRHADLRVFRHERERIRREPAERAEVLPLSGSFRALPEIVAATNAVGEALLDEFRPLTVGAERPAPDHPAVDVLLTPAGSEWKEDELGITVTGDYPSPPDRVAEARFLAARLRSLHDEHGVPARDMVVLLRAYTHVAAYEDELAKADLVPYVVGGRGYWSQQQVDDARRILGVIANPLDDHALLGALSSPACAVLPDTLWLLRRTAGGGAHLWPTVERKFGPARHIPRRGGREAEHAAGNDSWLDAIPERDAVRLTRFCATLAGLREDAPRLGLEELIDRAITALGYDLAALMLSGGPRRLANVRKLMRMARQYESAEGRDLRGFLDFVEESAGGSDREGEAATEAEEHEGVRVMTVHAAKGLEFPVVAVADLGRGLLLGGRPPAVRIDRADTDGNGGADDEPAPPRVGIQLARFGAKAVRLYAYDDLEEEAARDEAAEGCRLAYVAATRAQDHLILSGSYRPGKTIPGEGPPPTTPVSERLAHALGIDEPDDRVVTVPAPDPRPGLDAGFAPGRIAVRVNRPHPDAFRALIPAPRREDEPALAATGAPPIADRAREARPAPGHLSYSALAAYGRCGYRFYAERVLALGARGATGLDHGDSPAATEPPAAKRRFGLGNTVHALLEWSARHGWRAPPGELLVEALRRERLRDAERERVEGMVAAWLSSDLCAELRDGDARVRPEMPFLLPVADTVVRGTMDLLAETEQGLLVIDYKTDSLADASPDELVDRYAVQREIYALAASGGSAGPVRTAYAFLDREGSVVASEFGPDQLDAARGRVKELVAGVAEGRFEVTGSPHWALCNDCPARRRLCSHPKEITGRKLG